MTSLRVQQTSEIHTSQPSRRFYQGNLPKHYVLHPYVFLTQRKNAISLPALRLTLPVVVVGQTPKSRCLAIERIVLEVDGITVPVILGVLCQMTGTLRWRKLLKTVTS